MPSLRKAINEKCKECIYDPHPGNGNWRQQTGACSYVNCPLWPVRPTSEPRVPGSGEVPEALEKWRQNRGINHAG